VTCTFSALGGTRTPNLLIRRLDSAAARRRARYRRTASAALRGDRLPLRQPRPHLRHRRCTRRHRHRASASSRARRRLSRAFGATICRVHFIPTRQVDRSRGARGTRAVPEPARKSTVGSSRHGAVGGRSRSRCGGGPKPSRDRALSIQLPGRASGSCRSGQTRSRASCSTGCSPRPNRAIASRLRSSSPYGR